MKRLIRRSPFMRALIGRVILILLWIVLIAGCVLDMLAYPFWVIVDPKRAWLVAISVDDTSNVSIGGKLGTTISSHAARARNKGKEWGCVLCDFLDDINKNHCDRALTAHDQNLK